MRRLCLKKGLPPTPFLQPIHLTKASKVTLDDLKISNRELLVAERNDPDNSTPREQPHTIKVNAVRDTKNRKRIRMPTDGGERLGSHEDPAPPADRAEGAEVRSRSGRVVRAR